VNALKYDRDVLIICTRNRSNQIEKRLDEYRKYPVLPSNVLVVDSSDSEDTKTAIHNVMADFPANLHYLHTQPGLPFQRNTGIKWVLSHIGGLEIIHFLDDDIVPDQNYFLTLRKLFDDCPAAIAIGGYDKWLNVDIHSGRFRRLVGLGSHQTGLILKSGIAIPPVPTQRIHHCQWLVGGMQSFRTRIFEFALFDDALRMYGEDIEFYLRIAPFGEIICSNQLPVKHLNDPTNRDSIRKVHLYHNGIRWLLAARYPKNISRPSVLLGAVALACGEFVLFLIKRNKFHFLASVGNWQFLGRVITGRSTLQVR
jgi:GT2 family glycosyltransferase